MSREELYEQVLSAAERGDLTTARQLLIAFKFSRRTGQADVDLNVLLREAIVSEQNQIVELLLDVGADVGREDLDGRRAIHIASEVGNVVALKLVNRSGTSLNPVDRNGSSALHLSLMRGRRDAALFLISAGATVNRPRRYDSGETPMHVAARLGDGAVLAAALRRGAGRPDVQSSDGTTPLHIAARERHAACVDMLCSEARKGVINAVDKGHLTPLHCAVISSALDAVRALLRHGADPNAADRNGLTPLHYAAAATHPPVFSHSGVVDLLISHGADVCMRDNQQRTPLHLAAAVGNTSLVRMLLDAGADADAVERILGETPLNIAAAYGRYEAMQELCEAGCDVNIADKHGVAPLYKLLATAGNVSSCKYEAADLLLQHGAKVNVADERGVTPLQACVFHTVISRPGCEGISILRRLAAAGAVLRPSSTPTQRSIRNSPLCWLTWHGELKAAAFLVNAGWRLRTEHWICLPGKTDEIEQFLAAVRMISCNPDSLRGCCRAVIRTHLRSAADDCDVVPLILQLPLPSQIQRYLTLDSEYDLLY